MAWPPSRACVFVSCKTRIINVLGFSARQQSQADLKWTIKARCPNFTVRKGNQHTGQRSKTDRSLDTKKTQQNKSLQNRAESGCWWQGGSGGAQPRSAQQEGNSTSAAGSWPGPSLRAVVMSQTTCSPPAWPESNPVTQLPSSILAIHPGRPATHNTRTLVPGRCYRPVEESQLQLFVPGWSDSGSFVKHRWMKKHKLEYFHYRLLSWLLF